MHFSGAIIAFLALRLVAFAAEAPALKWNREPGFRWAEAAVADSGRAGFQQLLETRTNIRFTNTLAASRYITNQILLNGSGVAAGDVDGDGLCDIYFCALERPNALYKNLGSFRFEETTESPGVACAGQASTGATFADVDGDTDLDLLVNGINAGTRLFMNDGKGRFTERTDQAGLRSRTGSVSFALADIDGDTDLDLYVVNYRSHTLRDDPDTKFRLSTTNGVLQLLAVNGKPVTDPELAGRFTVDRATGILEHGEADVLYLNDGKGVFTAEAWTGGRFTDAQGKPLATPPYDWGLSAMFHDINADGAPDLYVCNDFHSEDRIWINDGHGKFRAIDPLAIRHTSSFSMGVDFSDIDRDGLDDFFVADMLSRDFGTRKVQVADRKLPHPRLHKTEDRPQYSHNTLFWNRGSGRYSEIAFMAGVEASGWSWSPLFMDVDLDGYEDLLITNGHGSDVQNIDIAREVEVAKKAPGLPVQQQLELRKRFGPLIYPNVAFRNGGKLNFEEVGAKWGFNSTNISHGLASADFDNDGDLDLVASCLNAAPLIYENTATAQRVAVRLRGAEGNTKGAGARVTLRNGAVPQQTKEAIAGGRYVSSDDPIYTFAMGGSTNASIEVRWRSGRQSVVASVAPNRIYEIGELGTAPALRPSSTNSSPRWFELLPVLGHHADLPFDDWERQPLVTRSLSYEGPALCWIDSDQDGWMDLLVSSGKGKALQLFGHQVGKSFAAKTLGSIATRDQVALLPFMDEGKPLAFVGYSNYEDGLQQGMAVRLVNFPLGRTAEVFTNFPASIGAMALGDPDGDGDEDLFVAARALPGKYPAPATSVFLRNANGLFQIETNLQGPFGELGLCTGALWADVDGQVGPELVVSCEWGSLRVFKWSANQFTEITKALGLDGFKGLWQSLAAADLNGDKRIDLVAGNIGLNGKYTPYLGKELRLFYSDVENDGIVEAVEAYQNEDDGEWFPIRDLGMLAGGLPLLKEKFTTFTAFSKVPVSTALSGRSVRHHSINTLASMVFMNRGGRFEAIPLPPEAQVSSLNSIAAADFNRDGRVDLFAAQNFYGTHPQDTRLDAGHGLALQGLGDGHFKALTIAESGIEVPGEARACAAADFNNDCALDLVVAENNGPIRVFRNATAAKKTGP